MCSTCLAQCAVAQTLTQNQQHQDTTGTLETQKAKVDDYDVPSVIKKMKSVAGKDDLVLAAKAEKA